LIFEVKRIHLQMRTSIPKVERLNLEARTSILQCEGLAPRGESLDHAGWKYDPRSKNPPPAGKKRFLEFKSPRKGMRSICLSSL